MELLTACQAAQELGVSRAAVYAAVRRRKLRAFREKPLLIERSSLPEYKEIFGVRNGYIKIKEASSQA